MNYKLMRSTILICSLSVLLILGMVLYANYKSGAQPVGSDNIENTDMGNDGNTNQAAGSHAGSSGGNIAFNGDTRAFLQDEYFWDVDPEGEERIRPDYGQRLSLIATSVQKDLRFQIVDIDGELVTGEPFFVTVEDVGQFKDLDRDGVIYIGDLSAGDYYASIDPIEGYQVASSQIRVHVNERLEYRTISDIALLILSEEDIDPSVDSVNGHNVNGDVDETEITDIYEGLETAVMGIDVSSFNGDIDWLKVREAGIEFVIIRCGYRGYTSGSLVEDKKFLQNITGAEEAGIRVGIYFFTQAINEVEAVEEASMAITLCKDYQIHLPIFIDTESTGGSGRADRLDRETRTAVCRAFCETVENAGYRAGVYASKNWINQMLNYSELTRYLTWLAEYKNNYTYEGDFQFWQYTSHGWIDGIPGRVDLDIGNMSFANLNPPVAQPPEEGDESEESSETEENGEPGAATPPEEAGEPEAAQPPAPEAGGSG